MYTFPILNGFRDRAILLCSTLYTVLTSNTMSSQELQSAFMLTVEFSKMCKLCQLCHLNNKYRY
jgi:hypothetical protein